MTDTLTATARSVHMARVRQRGTAPELAVRRAAHALGLRFRLHRRDLPGTPDLAFPGRRVAVYVHGCFWHQHPVCRYAYRPKSRVEFWTAKFAENIARDARVEESCLRIGWLPLVIWECETRDVTRLAAVIRERIAAVGQQRSR